MNSPDPAKTLSDLLEPGATLMVAIDSGTTPLEFRPLTVARVEGDRIEILLDTSEDWATAFADGALTYVTMSDTRSNTWVSLTGEVWRSTDQELIDELWSPFADAYFDEGRATPGITVLFIDAQDGRYWSGPSGRIGSLISVLKAKFGSPEESGESGDLKL